MNQPKNNKDMEPYTQEPQESLLNAPQGNVSENDRKPEDFPAEENQNREQDTGIPVEPAEHMEQPGQTMPPVPPVPPMQPMPPMQPGQMPPWPYPYPPYAQIPGQPGHPGQPGQPGQPIYPGYPQDNGRVNREKDGSYTPYPPYPPYYPYPPYVPASGRPDPQRKARKKEVGYRVFLGILMVIAVGLLVVMVSLASSYAGGSYVPETGSSQSPESSQPPQDSQVPDFPEGEKPSDAPAADYPGIVIQPREPEERSAKQIYKDVVQSVVGVNTLVEGYGLSEGSGIILSSDGLILTNAHVLNYSKTNAVSVALYDGTEYVASVIGYDKYSDLAVLRIDAEGLVPAVLGDASQLEVGDWVYAIGNPGGMSYASSLTGGFVSALNRPLSSSTLTYIQTDAAINPGNSGGALVNDCGQVVGINSNKIVSTSYEGMGFAIPISQVKSIIDNLITQGYVAGRGRLGITVRQTEDGLLLDSVDPESNLYGKAQKGDWILEADGETMETLNDLYAVLAGHQAGDTVVLKIYHTQEEKEAEYSVILLEDKGETQK